jgi:hypothetical protein
MVDISKLDRPKTRLMEALGNVEITNEYRAIPGVYYFD